MVVMVTHMVTQITRIWTKPTFGYVLTNFLNLHSFTIDRLVSTVMVALTS